MKNKRPRILSSRGGKKNSRHLKAIGRLANAPVTPADASDPVKEYFRNTDFSSGFFLRIGRGGIEFGPYDSMTDQTFDLCEELE